MHIEFATAINNRGEIVGDASLPTGEIHVVTAMQEQELRGRDDGLSFLTLVVTRDLWENWAHGRAPCAKREG